MKTFHLRAAMAVLPFLVPLVVWQLAEIVGHVVGCSVPLLPPAVCMYEHIDVNLLLGPIAQWAMRLSLLGFLAGCVLLAFMWLRTGSGPARDRSA